eukprot:SAG31_NODE_9080_length_1338_cov_1.995964_2_plen_82_part_00
MLACCTCYCVNVYTYRCKEPISGAGRILHIVVSGLEGHRACQPIRDCWLLVFMSSITGHEIKIVCSRSMCLASDRWLREGG